MTRDTAIGSRGAEPSVTPVSVSRWSRTASAFTGACAVAVLILAVIPYVIGGPAEQPLITLLTFIAMASLWNLLAGFSGLTSFGQQAYIGVGAYALYLVALHGINPFGGMATIEGPIVGALVLFALQETLSAYGAWYLVIVGALAVVTTLVAPRGLWGLASERLGWSLLPVGYRVRSPAPPGRPARRAGWSR
jgi:ABC-type branched-subunit amino acid transport system permease subunit